MTALDRHCEEQSDAAIQWGDRAPGHAAHLPWITTPFGLAMTVKGRRAPDDDPHMVDDDGIPGFRPAPE
jgi:hypothetical protein